jgi:hypothetical protein
MEIDEFLTRISLSGADPTIFSLYEKGKNISATGKELFFDNRTLKTYTKAEDASVVGMIRYEKPFPKTIFAMEPEGLKNILAESSDVRIEDTYLMASGNMDFMWKLEVLGKSKSMDFQYERPDILLTKDTIAKIVRADRILDASTILIEADGKEVTITLTSKIKSNRAKIIVPSTVKPFDALYEKRFVECLKLCGERDVKFNADGKKSGRNSGVHGAGMIQISDDTATITYYVTEITRSVSQEKKSSGDEVVGDESAIEGDSNANDESNPTLDEFHNSDAELNGDL